MQNFHKLNESGEDAVEYDLQFRTMKHQHPSIQWGEYLGEIVDALPIKARKYPPKAQNSNKGKGVCRKYNSRNGCSFRNCKFLYICQSCRSDHPVLQCTKKWWMTYSASSLIGLSPSGVDLTIGFILSFWRFMLGWNKWLWSQYPSVCPSLFRTYLTLPVHSAAYRH